MISIIGHLVFLAAIIWSCESIVLQKLALSPLLDYQYTDLSYVRNVHFKYYDRYSNQIATTDLMEEDAAPYKTYQLCDPKQKFAILIHGWKENCDTEWMNWMVSNLTQFRGGCIMCMDFGRYTLNRSYLQLYRDFDGIAEVLAGKLRQMEKRGFNPNKGFIFGFSYGGRLAVEASKRFGPKKINQIDICDIAGPMFDFRNALVDHRMAAKNVQCIHTSRDKGSRHTTACHQNWKMGNCGWTQPAAVQPPLGSHGLCPYFYLSAFTHNFEAVPKPSECTSRRLARRWPSGFKMGYMENRKMQVQGELFALTTKKYPFNSNASDYAPINSNSWDIDLVFDPEYNHIPRSRRNPTVNIYV